MTSWTQEGWTLSRSSSASARADIRPTFTNVIALRGNPFYDYY
jgi:hypothetical protein